MSTSLRPSMFEYMWCDAVCIPVFSNYSLCFLEHFSAMHLPPMFLLSILMLVFARIHFLTFRIYVSSFSFSATRCVSCHPLHVRIVHSMMILMIIARSVRYKTSGENEPTVGNVGAGRGIISVAILLHRRVQRLEQRPSREADWHSDTRHARPRVRPVLHVVRSGPCLLIALSKSHHRFLMGIASQNFQGVM